MEQNNVNSKSHLSRIKNKILVLSGKGGVGKSTVAVNLAAALAEEGYNVGIMDVDIHGPNVAKMLGVQDKPLELNEDDLVIPIQVYHNLKAVSIANFIAPDQPVIWRGPLKQKAIDQFLNGVAWGDLDYLVIDCPPGTGDEPLSVIQIAGKVDGAVLVTTPQEVSQMDAKRAGVFLNATNSKLLGVVENMSYFVCPKCGERLYMYGQGGGEKLAEELSSDLLVQIPQDPEIVKLGDSGKTIPTHKRNSILEDTFKDLAKEVMERLDNKE